MSLFSRDSGNKLTTLQQQGGTVLADVREALLQTSNHLEALVELFQVELKEYGEKQARRIAALVVGVFLLLCAYAVFCAFACVLLSSWLGWLWAVAVVCLINVLLGGVALWCGLKCKPGPVAPATMQELKDDVQCIRLMLKENKKS
ncbi:MAG: phage holin family protein [Akkermansia sp.]|nr:phage holin family protein [Akkermansia sp.]